VVVDRCGCSTKNPTKTPPPHQLTPKIARKYETTQDEKKTVSALIIKGLRRFLTTQDETKND
jgi:hypothetical protein